MARKTKAQIEAEARAARERQEKIAAIYTHELVIKLRLTSEEYAALCERTIHDRNNPKYTLPDWAKPTEEVVLSGELLRRAVAHDVSVMLGLVVRNMIGHEGSPTYRARMEQINAEYHAAVSGTTRVSAA